MTVALYCRVSTEDQATHGHSIESQMQRLEAYCKSQGWDDFEFYVDGGYSGTTMDRPQLRRLIRHIEQGKIDSVIVYRLDRLSRKQRDVLFLIEDVFDKQGVAFRSATEPFDTSTPLGKAMLSILAVFAQLERETIMERVRTGIVQRAKKGLWHGGPVPFGYDWNKDTSELVTNPIEAPLVKEIFTRYLNGQSLLSIANWLSKRNNSRYIDHTFINDLLRRPAYAGLIPRDGEVLPGTHEAIIDEETYWETQEEMNRRKGDRAPYKRFLLSNLCECGCCGAPVKMNSRKHPKYNYTYRYYACSAKLAKATNCTESKRVEYRKLQSRVIEEIKKYSLHVDVESEIAAQHHVPDHTDEIVELERELESIDTKIDNIIAAVRDGVFTSKRAKPQMDELEARRSQIEARIDELQELPQPKTMDDLVDAVKTIGKSWDILTEDEQYEVLRNAVSKVVVWPEKVDIVWNT